MISHKYKCIFIHIPKCAGTSIEEALGHFDDYTGVDAQDHRMIRYFENPIPYKYILRNKSNFISFLRSLKWRFTNKINPKNNLKVTIKQYHEYFKFTIVRNPWDRVFSAYKNIMRDESHIKLLGIKKDLQFIDFVRNYAGNEFFTMPAMEYLKNYNGEITMDHIGRFENLETDFKKICEKMELSNIKLPHKLNRNNKDSYRDFYDSETMQLVAEIYEEEIGLFGYQF